jgi:serine-type D-Ala-D-Ala carboxypeptidase
MKMKERMTSSRREFLGGLTMAGAGAFLGGCATNGAAGGGTPALPAGRETVGRGVLSAPQDRAVADELHAQVASGLIAGGVCATRGERIWHDGIMRFDPPVPMREDALFDLASAAKTFTASLCALLYADGRLDPDAPFTEYLPEHVLAKENHGITVRDLATHSGGFDNSKPYIVSGPREFNRRLYAKRPVRPRGERFDYACSNMIYLGRIVEHVTGLDLETAAEKMLWGPLGMTETVWHNIPGNARAVEAMQNAHPPIGFKGDEQARAYPSAMGNGAAFSCAADVMKFLEDLCTRRAFPKAYYDLLFTPCFDKGGERRSFGWDMGAEYRPDGWSLATVRHGGFTGVTFAVDPESGYAGVVLTNRTGDRVKGYHGHQRLLSLMTVG